MSLLAEFVSLVGPSESPYPRRPWAAVESELGFGLPADYKAWGDAYCSVDIDGFLAIDNYAMAPFDRAQTPDWAPPFPASIESVLGTLVRGWAIGGRRRILDDTGNVIEANAAPLPVYPDPGGLLLWGTSSYTGYFMWRTHGDPDEWTVVVADRDGDCWEYDGGFLDFLVGAFTRRIRCPMVRDEWWRQPALEELVGVRSRTLMNGRATWVMDMQPTSRWRAYFEEKDGG